MCPLVERNTYARVSYDNMGQLIIYYNIDYRDKIEWDSIQDHAKMIKKLFEQIIKKKITLNLALKLH